MASCCCCRAIAAARLRVVGGEDGRHVVVQEVDRLLDDPLEQRVVGGLGDGRVEGHVVLGGEHLAGAGRARSDSRCRSSRVARRAARPAASISTALRISMSSMMRSAPVPSRGARGAGEAAERGGWRRWCPGRPRPDDEQPLGLQLAQGLAHRRPADAQPRGQIALGGDAVARLVLAGGDELAELLGDLVGDGLRGRRAASGSSAGRAPFAWSARRPVAIGMMVTPSPGTADASTDRRQLPANAALAAAASAAEAVSPRPRQSAASSRRRLALRLAAILDSRMPNS